MATRTHARESVISFLYAYQVGNADIKKHCDEILEDRKIRNKQKDFAKELFEGIMVNLEKIDSLIEKHTAEWGFDRVGDIEKAILRLGTYELMNASLDSAIIINEAIEMAKKLANDTSPKFINGVLDAIKKEIKG
ncbi:MAG: transcription antitermination factor NusB [Campylobacterales bacterium]|nr:transcription antitermination factor NusB [Campylobacterales bacterium]